MEYEDRPYQSECLDALGESAVHRNLSVLPTGSGKTCIFSRYRTQIPGRTLMISHRREIIGVWEYERKPESTITYDHESEVRIIR